MKFTFPWFRRLSPPIEAASYITQPAQDIGDFLRAEAIVKCKEARDLAERADADMAVYFLTCAIDELHYPSRAGG
ncbi:hypothetical protein [Methylocapsa acidiphila]|uniref:hypothetical protein n=1 Tax=Methylocapsa acidiphila TaxID=133552 RepID=UPI000402E9E3|nr:hypothetical protein [Methylocapsa acidiphila]